MTAAAADVNVGPFALDLPADFAGPINAKPDAYSEIVAYSSAGRPGEPVNVIQFTRHGVDDPPLNAGESDYVDTAANYLRQMLRGIERERTGYVQSPVTGLKFAGRMGARANWSGALQGLPTNGVMYCAIIGRNAWFIHVFGTGEKPDRTLQSLIAAVEHQAITTDASSASSGR